MNAELTHLSELVQSNALQDSAARIRLVQSARWVGFERAQQVLREINRRFSYPVCARMPCMLLYGESGMGKTMLIEKIERDHPAFYDEARGVSLRPVLTVQMPASPDERRLFTRILEILGVPHTSRDQLSAIESRALHVLHEIDVKLLCIDEVHHLLAGNYREQRRALNLLKFLANELRISVIAIGTQDALHALQADPQVATRFEPVLLPRWSESDAFRAFVVAYGRLLPLRKPSPFAEPATIRALLRLGGGVTGHVTSLLARAAEVAIIEGLECIEVPLLERVQQHSVAAIH